MGDSGLAFGQRHVNEVNFTVTHGACVRVVSNALQNAFMQNATELLPGTSISQGGATDIRGRLEYQTVYASCAPEQCTAFDAAWRANVTQTFVDAVAASVSPSCPNVTFFGVGVPVPPYTMEDLLLESSEQTACSSSVVGALFMEIKMTDAACGACLDELGSCPTSILERATQGVPMTECVSSDTGLCEFSGAWTFIIIMVAAGLAAIVLASVGLCWIYERRKKRVEAAASRAEATEDDEAKAVVKADVGSFARLRV
jgi:hypothetical protein